MRGRLTLIAALAALAVPALAGPAAAGPLPGGRTDDGQPTATVTSTTTTPGSPGAGAGSRALRCTYTALPSSELRYELSYNDGDGSEGGLYGTSESGRWATRTCYDQLGRDVSSTVVPLAAGGGAVAVDPRVLLEDALARLAIPDPAMAANPPVGSAALVRMPTWLWLDGDYWRPRSATASAGGASATVTATPVTAEWSMGDGAVVSCEGPGQPWSPAAPASAPSPCSHTYLTSSSAQPGDTYALTATVTWSVTWTSTVPGIGGELEDQTRSASVRVPVIEVQGLGQ